MAPNYLMLPWFFNKKLQNLKQADKNVVNQFTANTFFGRNNLPFFEELETHTDARRNKNHKFSKLIIHRHRRLKINKFKNQILSNKYKKFSRKGPKHTADGSWMVVEKPLLLPFWHFSTAFCCSNNVQGENFLLPALQLLPVYRYYIMFRVCVVVCCCWCVAITSRLCCCSVLLCLSDKFLRFSLTQRTRQNHCNPPPARPLLFFWSCARRRASQEGVWWG